MDVADGGSLAVEDGHGLDLGGAGTGDVVMPAAAGGAMAVGACQRQHPRRRGGGRLRLPALSSVLGPPAVPAIVLPWTVNQHLRLDYAGGRGRACPAR